MNTEKRLSEYNRIIKETDEIYHDAAKRLGLPDCAFWILYAIREGDEPLTQSEVCRILYQPKQTVNSALKKLESGGYITLLEKEGRRGKTLCLTERGQLLAGRTVDRILTVEKEALGKLTVAEQESFIRCFRKYTDLLEQGMRGITKN